MCGNFHAFVAYIICLTMKKYLLLLGALSLFTSLSWSQSNRIAEKAAHAHEYSKSISYDLFTATTYTDARLSEAFSEWNRLRLNKEALAGLLQEMPTTIDFDLPVNGSWRKLKLVRKEIYAPGFKAWTLQADGSYKEDEHYKPGVFYQGYVEGYPVSLAAFSFYENELGGVFSLEEEGNFNLVMDYDQPGENYNNYLLFKESDIKDNSMRGGCGASEALRVNEAEPATKAFGDYSGTCKTVSVAMYGDYKLYQNRGASITSTQNYLTTLFNGNATLFENDEIGVMLLNLFVHSVQDNYPSTNSADVLYRFGGDVGVNTSADIMQMVTGYMSQGYAPMGGLAWLDALCATPIFYPPYNTYIGPYSMVNNTGLGTLPNVPVYSWDIYASTHEMGHNLGSPHTHDCSWNGDNTAIDGCGPTYNAALQGNCPIATVPVKGTIMSYCHLVQGVGINFNLGFGPQPKARIKDKIAAATCVYSAVPQQTVASASQTITANQFCINNDWAYFYFDNNDHDAANDIFVLAVYNTDFSMSDLSNAEVSVTTGSAYGSNTATIENHAYTDYEDWHVMNRKWKFDIGRPITGVTRVRFSSATTDYDDLRGSVNALSSPNQMKAVVYRNDTVFNNPATGNSTNIEAFNYQGGMTPGSWIWVNELPNFNTAQIIISGDFYGGTMGYGSTLKQTGIGTASAVGQLTLYPDPAHGELFIDAAALQAASVSLSITDNLGREVMRKTFNTPTDVLRVDIQGFASGFYTLKLIANDKVYLSKFIKQ